MRQANRFLRELYLDYVNNYLTVEKLAEHHELKPENAAVLIALGREYHEEYVELTKAKQETTE